MSTAWLITSGKGGVGKTTLTACLGRALAASGQRVCVLDADIGLRDLDILLGVENRIVYDLLDLCGRDCTPDQALIPADDARNLYLLPAAQMARSRDLNKKDFQRTLALLKERFDHILIDCPAGIERGLRALLNPQVDETLLVCTPDDMCLRDAERVVSLLNDKSMPRPRLIVNRLNPPLIARRIMHSARTSAAILDLSLMGEVPEDPGVYQALLRRRSLLDLDSGAGDAVVRIASRMQGKQVPFPAYGQEKRYWLTRMTHRRKEVSSS